MDNEMRGYHHDMSLYRGWHKNDAMGGDILESQHIEGSLVTFKISLRAKRGERFDV